MGERMRKKNNEKLTDQEQWQMLYEYGQAYKSAMDELRRRKEM